MPESIFADHQSSIYVRYAVGLHVFSIVGGVPSNPKVIEGWIRTNLGSTTEEEINRLVAQTMIDRGIEANEAAEVVAAEAKLNGFKRDESGLYTEGRHVKAMLKENALISWPRRQWGPTKKGTKGWWAEHVHVLDDRIYHGRDKADREQQRFVSTFRGTSMVYEEVNYDVDLSFTILVDGDEQMSGGDWADLWTRAEQNGLGAVRSQGFGKFVVTRFELAG